MSSVKRTIFERIMSRVRVLDNGCWEYLGCTNHGYAWVSTDTRNHPVHGHQAVYEAVNGPVPDGFHIHHACHKPEGCAGGPSCRRCVNPDHLKAVTCKENIKAGCSGVLGKGKTHCPQGHLYNEENSYIYKGTHRLCRKCHSVYTGQWSKRNRARVNEKQRQRRAKQKPGK
jgi:hypothetical protein